MGKIFLCLLKTLTEIGNVERASFDEDRYVDFKLELDGKKYIVSVYEADPPKGGAHV